MFDLFPPIDALRLWLCLGTLDLMRNVGSIEELLDLGREGHAHLAQEPPHKRILGRIRIWALLPPMILVVVLLAIVFWPIVLGYDLRRRRPINWKRQPAADAPFVPRRKELKEQLTIEQVEARERVHDPLKAVPDAPFGFLNPAWQQFVAARQPGDRLRRFESPRKQWGEIVVREGYAWVKRRHARIAWVCALRRD